MAADQLSFQILEQVLGNRPLRYFESIGSTNDVAQKWALEGTPAGSVVIADEQRAGRGRMGRGWQTPPQQALAMSVVLRPTIDPNHLQRVTMLGGVAVAEVVRTYVTTAIKWPNDILIGSRKVCGILAEALWQGETLKAVVLGIGLNIRVNFVGTPLEGIATSLEDHATQPISRVKLITQLLDHMDYWSARIHDPLLVATWREWLITIGQHVHIQTQQGMIDGTAYDVDSAGALLVVDAEGHKHRVTVGDVRVG